MVLRAYLCLRRRPEIVQALPRGGHTPGPTIMGASAVGRRAPRARGHDRSGAGAPRARGGTTVQAPGSKSEGARRVTRRAPRARGHDRSGARADDHAGADGPIAGLV